MLRLGDVREFLAQAIEPPPEGAIASALRSLMELDAVDAADELTPLGHHLAELPVDARLGKMMLYGAMFGCLDPVLTIAASVGFRSPFLAPMEKRDEADEAKRKLAGHGATSDHLTLVRAYAGWIRAKSRGRAHERDFLAKAFLSAQTLRQISEMRQQYVELLDQIGFLRSGAGLLGGKADERETEGGETKTEKADERETEGGETKTEKADERETEGGETKTERDEATGNAPSTTSSRRRARSRRRRAPTSPRLPRRSFRNRGWRLRRGTRSRSSVVAVARRRRRLRFSRRASTPGTNLWFARCRAPVYFQTPRSSRDEAAPVRVPEGPARRAKSSCAPRATGKCRCTPRPCVSAFRPSNIDSYSSHEKVKTTKVYVRDATMVGPYPLLLFGGKVKVDHERASALCDGWIRFRAAPRVAVLFKALRAELDGLLMQKIATPELNIAEKSGELVETIVELLESERAVVAEARAEERRAEEARRAEKA